MNEIDKKLRSRIRVIIRKQWKVPKNKSNQIVNSARYSRGRSKSITFLWKRAKVHWIIKSCPKSNLKQKTKAEVAPFCFRPLSKSTHCNIN
nr:hypothetical protein [Bacillus marasmi]